MSLRNILNETVLIIKMNVKIWRILAQILFYRNDTSEVLKPFFENLKNENINDEKYIPFLKTFSKNQLKALYDNRIITREKFNLLNPKDQKETNFTVNDINIKIEEIISGDKIKELDKLIQEKDIKAFNSIIKSFFEVEKMKIPLIQYCIMKKAIECFKYLLVNGFDDPNKVMEEEFPEVSNSDSWLKTSMIKIRRYQWDCMATAIYFGNKKIIKLLEEKGIEKGKNETHIEAAILSYRNTIAKEIINEMNEQKEEMENFLNKAILTSSKNNIQETIFLIKKGANINHNAYNNQKNQ